MRPVILCSLPLLLALAPAPDRASIDREIALGIPPQPPRAADLHRRARPVRADAWTGMLVCSVEIVGHGWDGGDPSGPVRRLAGRPEVDLEVTIGEGTRPLRYFGREDTPSVVFAMPHIALARGTKVKLDVEDRDVVRNDPAGTVELVYAGELPMRGHVEGVRVDCRAAPEREVEAGIEAAMRRVDAAIAALPAAGEANADSIDFGFDRDADDAARLAVYDLARFAGLADARVTAALARLDERERVFTQRAAALVLTLRGSAKPTDVPFRLPGTTIDARVGPQSCREDRGFAFALGEAHLSVECAIPIAIEEAESARPPALTFHGLDAQGRFTPAEIWLTPTSGALTRPRGGRLPTGTQSVVLTFSGPDTQLLRIGLPTGSVFVNVARAAR